MTVIQNVGARRLPTASSLRIMSASFVGTTLEFYDFFIYGTMAALVFKQLFFPGYSNLAGTLAAFGTFAVGFIARPLGSVFFGFMGDRLGRRATLVLSLCLMGGSTVAIGLLPSFATAGIMAPILLVVIRLVQGLALGGEWGGAALLLVESAPAHRKSLMGSIVQMGAPAGLLLATGVTAVSSAFAGDHFATWGWRIPFLFSAILLAVAFWIRHGVAETPEFVAMQAHDIDPPRMPLRTVFRERGKALLLAFCLASPGNVIFTLVSAYTLSYTTVTLGMPRAPVLTALMAASLIYLFTIPLFGALADRIGQRKVIGFGCFAALLFAFFYFQALDSRSVYRVFFAMTGALAIVHAALQAPQAGLFASWFRVEQRYTGVALAQAIPTTVIGGTAPLLATYFMASTGNTIAISAYVGALGILGLVAALVRSAGSHERDGLLA